MWRLISRPSVLLQGVLVSQYSLTSSRAFHDKAGDPVSKQHLSQFDVFLTAHHSIDLSKYQNNAQFFYFSTIYMLHYAPQHVSSSTLLIIRRTDCITTASGIVTLCKQPYSMQVDSGLGPLSTCILYGCL